VTKNRLPTRNVHLRLFMAAVPPAVDMDVRASWCAAAA
jgi:hypothetical protein